MSEALPRVVRRQWALTRQCTPNAVGRPRQEARDQAGGGGVRLNEGRHRRLAGAAWCGLTCRTSVTEGAGSGGVIVPSASRSFGLGFALVVGSVA